MNTEVRKRLEAMAESSYKEFSSSLIPESKPLLGVRLPALRMIAKEMVKNDSWREHLATEDMYFEEVMLRGMCMGYGTSKEDNMENALELLDTLLPCVDNWSICDSCCASYTIFEKHRQEGWPYIQKLLDSKKEFSVRVGLILLLDHYLKGDSTGKKMPRKRQVEISDLECLTEECGLYTKEILRVLNQPFTEGYYAQMAAAWLTAECFVTFPQQTWEFLQCAAMDPFTYNKALQKICESRIPAKEVKEQVQKLRRK